LDVVQHNRLQFSFRVSFSSAVVQPEWGRGDHGPPKRTC